MASGEDYPPVNRLVDVMGSLGLDDDGRSGGAGESSSSEDIQLDSLIVGNGPAASGNDDEDASLLVYRWGFNRCRRQRQDRSPEVINDNLVAGPPMMDFNEPLLVGPAEEIVMPNAINSGDIGPTPREGELTLAHAVISNNSFEDLQSVVSQLGLETSLQQKASCHSPHSQGSCRHASHNISLESLDLGTGLGHCCTQCNHPHQYRTKRGMNKRCSCQF